MTRGAGGRVPGVPRLWVLPLGVIAGVAASVGAGVTSRSVVLDLLAWWPVWGGVTALMVVARGRYLGLLRLSGLVPLVGFAVSIVFVTGHVQGWEAMPSASGRLIGPVPEFTRASLDASVDGRLEVTGGPGFLYEVTPIRWGGEVGIPDALEQASNGSVVVSLLPPVDPGLQAFAGWHLRLSSEPVWDLTLGGEVMADLSALSLSGVDLVGTGLVTLGPVSRVSGVLVDGSFTIRFPADVPVRVVGEAVVPDGWERLPDGWHSPGPGDGWVVTAAPGSRLVVEAPS